MPSIGWNNNMHYGHSLILKFNLNRIRIVKLESSLYVYFNQ